MAYEKRISDWSSDVCSSDLIVRLVADDLCVFGGVQVEHERVFVVVVIVVDALGNFGGGGPGDQIWHFQTSGAGLHSQSRFTDVTADHGDDVVLIPQSLKCSHACRGRTVGVILCEFPLPSVNAAVGIAFVGSLSCRLEDGAAVEDWKR